MPAQRLHEIVETLQSVRTHTGQLLAELSSHSPVLLVFLRHAGCTFCREALGDLARARRDIEASGTSAVLVHMGDEQRICDLLERYGLSDVDRICDPEQRLYAAFGLKRGTLLQLLGPRVWWRGLKAGVLDGHGIGRVSADSAQLPGAFLIGPAGIVRSFRHRSAADRPSYRDLAAGRAE